MYSISQRNADMTTFTQITSTHSHTMEDTMRTITNAAGTEIDFDAAVQLMDDDIREAIHFGDGDPTGSNDRPGSEQQFFEWYSRLHAEKFGVEFEPNKRNPVW